MRVQLKEASSQAPPQAVGGLGSLGMYVRGRKHLPETWCLPGIGAAAP